MSSTPPSLTLPKALRQLLLAGLMLWVQAWALAQGVLLQQFGTERTEDGLHLNFSTRFELPRQVEEALSKGLPVYFVAEAEVLRNRWYWRDARVARATRSWRLSWQPLTRQYRVSTGGLHQSFETLAEAMASLRGVSSWRIADAKDIEDDGRYYLEFSYKLDTSQLPKPMQIGLGAPQGWTLAVERNVPLNMEFGAKPAP